MIKRLYSAAFLVIILATPCLAAPDINGRWLVEFISGKDAGFSLTMSIKDGVDDISKKSFLYDIDFTGSTADIENQIGFQNNQILSFTEYLTLGHIHYNIKLNKKRSKGIGIATHNINRSCEKAEDFFESGIQECRFTTGSTGSTSNIRMTKLAD